MVWTVASKLLSCRLVQQIEWTEDGPIFVKQHMGIDHGGRHVLVAKQFLDGPDVDTRLQKVGREGMSKRVRSDVFIEVRLCHRGSQSLRKRIAMQVVSMHFLGSFVL